MEPLLQTQSVLNHFQLIPYNIKLNRPWHSASTELFFRQGLLVKLIIDDENFAIGECAPMEEIGTESLAQAHDFLTKKLPTMLGKKIDFDALDDMNQYPASRFALETAILSLHTQQKNQSIAQFLNPEFNSIIKVNAMLGKIDKNLISHALQAEDSGFNCLKIKLGLDSIKNEANVLERLINKLSKNTSIRLDANKSWSVAETQWLLNYLQAYEAQIDCIEEPLQKYNQSNYQTLQDQTHISLALDESFCKNDFINFPDQYPVDTLVLKPMAQGGIINTLELARLAEQSKIKTIITSSIETAYGLWPIAHLCAAINNDQHHGLATASWLEDTFIKPPEIIHGIIKL